MILLNLTLVQVWVWEFVLVWGSLVVMLIQPCVCFVTLRPFLIQEADHHCDGYLERVLMEKSTQCVGPPSFSA